MSAIALEHVCAYDVRRGILTDVLAALKPGGLLSLQLTYRSPALGDRGGADASGADAGGRRFVTYFVNDFEASATNGARDVRVTDVDVLRRDFEDVGFVDVDVELGDVPTKKSTVVHAPDQWVFVTATKAFGDGGRGLAADVRRDEAQARCLLTRPSPECLPDARRAS